MKVNEEMHELSNRKMKVAFEFNQISLEEKIEEMAINFTLVRSTFFLNFTNVQ